MRIVITGSTGYIGNKLIEKLKQNGHKIYAVVRINSDIEKIRKNVEELVVSTPFENLSNKMQEIAPEVYINLAGYYCASHNVQDIGKLLDSNINFPTYMLDAVWNAGCKQVIHTASVQQCFGGEHYNPINLYAATKQAFEEILYYYTAGKGVKAVILQLFDTYGADDTRKKVFNLVRGLKEGEHMAMSSGKQKLYFCYIEDVIEAYIYAVDFLEKRDAGFHQRYAVRRDEPIELRTFIEKYIELSKKEIRIEWGGREHMEREIMDPTGIGEILPGWKAKTDYFYGLELCSNYDRKKENEKFWRNQDGKRESESEHHNALL